MAFPDQVLDLAEERRLGEPLRVHGDEAPYRHAVTWLVLLCPLGLPLLPASAYFIAHGSYWMGGVGVPMSLVFLTGIWLVLRGGALRGGGQVFYLFERGFVRTAWRSAQPWPWDELRSVTVAGSRGFARRRRNRWRFTAVRADGRKASFGVELPGARELGEVVAAEAARRAVPRLLARVKAGERVTVGPFSIDRQGVEKDGVQAPWTVVEEAGVRDGLAFVRRSDGLRGMGALASGMPNAVAFGELCRKVRDAVAGEPGAFGSGGVLESNSLDS